MDDLELDELPTVPIPDAPTSLPVVVSAVVEMANRLGEFDPAAASPAVRSEVQALRGQLRDLRDPVDLALRRIDAAYNRVYAEKGIRKFPLANGTFVEIQPPAGSYRTKEHDLRRALSALVPNVLTQEELDEALPTVITVKPNHTKLNALARNRGEEVAAIIDQYREAIPGSPLNATVKHPQGAAR